MGEGERQMPIPVNQLINLEVVTVASIAAGGSNSRPMNLVTHWRRTSTVPGLSKSSIDTAYQAAIAVPLFAALNITVTQQHNDIRFLNDATDAYLSFTHTIAGAVAGDRMKSTNAAFLLKRTGLRGRNYLGKQHLGPMSESDTTTGTDDIWNAGCLTRLATFSAALLAGFTDSNGNTWIPSVWSKIKSQIKTNPTNIVANDVTQIAVAKRVGSAKFRQVKQVY
jgi:hypothetical protein